MLAHQHGLALITEKLQNQRLEEPAGGTSGVAPSGVTTSSSLCGKLPAVNQETFLISDHHHHHHHQHHPGHSGQSTTALSVKGKNVWTLSLEADRPTHGHPQHLDSSGSGPSLLLHQTSSPKSIVCRHKKLRHLCQICDTSPGTPSAPPKKKHCRSLSVPPDGPSTPTLFPSGKDSSASPCTRFSIGIGGHPSGHHSHHHHHHHSSKIWRPIPVVPLRRGGASSNVSNNNSNKNSSSNSNNRHKDRHSSSTATNVQHLYPLSIANNNNNNSDNDSSLISSSSILTSVSGFDDYNNNYYTSNNNNDDDNYRTDSFTHNITPASSSSSRSCSSSSSNLLKKLMPPSSISSASFDSGHFTTSDLQTPPSSPIPQPRPASAASDASFSSVGWFDCSPSYMRSRLNVLQNRSLSCEDRISACSSCSSSASPFSPSSASGATTTTSMPCVYNSSNNPNSYGGRGACGGSGDDRGGTDESGGGCCLYHAGRGGVSGSSREGFVPRCHSQPCVLHHRRCGKKRRRDCDRPTLNFNKMTETAYMPPHPHRKSEPWSSPSYDAQVRSWQGHGQTQDFTISSNQSYLNPFYLNTIASSPLDSSDHFISRHLQQARPSGSESLYDTNVDQGSSTDRSALRVDSVMLGITPQDISRRSGVGEKKNDAEEEEEEDDDDEEEEEEEDEEDRNCSCHQDSQRKSENVVGVFPMGDLEDLDLEQIETH